MQHIGVDIIEIARIEEAITHWGDRFLNRIYTTAELELCSKNPSALAARFASKEAVMKLLGTGTRGIDWKEIETLAHSSGQPVINLFNKAQAKAEELELTEIAISLSHSRKYAIAMAVGVSK